MFDDQLLFSALGLEFNLYSSFWVITTSLITWNLLNAFPMIVTHLQLVADVQAKVNPQTIADEKIQQ